MNQENSIWIVTLVLFTLSAYLSFAYSPELAKQYSYENSYIFFYEQLKYIFAGLLIIFGLSKLSAEKYFNKVGVVVLSVSTILMIALYTITSSMISSVEGIKIYIVIGGFSIAPMFYFIVGLLWLMSYFYKKDIKTSVLSLISILVLGSFYLLVSSEAIAFYFIGYGSSIVLSISLLVGMGLMRYKKGKL